VNEKKKSKPAVQLVEISTPDGKYTYPVRHHDPRQAKAWLLEQRVTARRADQDEVIAIVEAGETILGPFEKTALDEVDDSQLSLPGTEQ
jgi:hypothetical protein